MLEERRDDGKYVIPSKPTLQDCLALNLDLQVELRNHQRVVERLYKRNTADKRAQKRAQSKAAAILVYMSVEDWLQRAVEPHHLKSRLAHPDKLPGYPDAPSPENCASQEVHASIQARQAELYLEFRRERLKFQGKAAYTRQLARAAGLASAVEAEDGPVDAEAGAVETEAVDEGAEAEAVAAAETVDEGAEAETVAAAETVGEGSKRKRESEDAAVAKRQRVYKKRTARQKALGKQKNAERANIIAENRRKWQKANYAKRADKNKEYLKEWRKSERGTQISDYHHSKAASGVMQLSSSAAARGYAQSLHPDQVAVLCALPCMYCGVGDNINIDRVINTDDYSLENGVPCCTICNHMKRELQVDKFIAHRNRIVQYQTYQIHVPAEQDGSLQRMFSKYHNSALKRGIDWSLSKEQFELLTRICSSCFFCGDSENFMGVDRKDNSVGYTVTNSVSCCKMCNYFKWDLSVDAFIEKCKRGVEWLTRHPIDVARSEIHKKMPTAEQMATSLVVHSTQDARKIRKPPAEIAPETPVYFLKSWKIKKFHLYLDCGGGRVTTDASLKWQTFATQTIPRRLVPENVTLCLSCAHAQSSLHAHAPAVTFSSDEAALEWLQSASSAFGKGAAGSKRKREDAGLTDEQKADERRRKAALRMEQKRAAETNEQKAERLRKAALHMREVRQINKNYICLLFNCS